MTKFRLIFVGTCCALGCFLAAPTFAGAKTIEIGNIGGLHDPKPSCNGSPAKDSCFIIIRTTAYTTKHGGRLNPYVVPQDGRVVAWSVSLGTPTPAAIKDQNDRNGISMGGITLLRKQMKTVVKKTRRGKKTITRKTLVDDNTAVAVGQTPQRKLEPYFGQTVQFPLSQQLQVRKGDILAFTTTSWSPNFGNNQSRDDFWRTSRQKCEPEFAGLPTAQSRLGDTTRYMCAFSGTRPLYGVTLIPNPRPTPKPKPKPKPKVAPKKPAAKGATPPRRATRPAPRKPAARSTTRR
jgi:hypothetical protein